MRKYLIVTWGKVLLWLLPPILRRQRHYRWLIALLKPLETLYDQTLYQMQHNGQIIYLEKVLNETFNPTVSYDPNLSINGKRDQKMIYIDETLQPRLQFVYKHSEYYLHTEQEHTELLPTDSDGNVILDELGFLDPIDLFTCNEFKCLTNPLDMSEACINARNLPVYNTYLATGTDFTDVAYANFRIMIPADLNIDITDFDLNNDNNVSDLEIATALQKITNEIYFTPHPNIEKELAGAVEVRTPRFHQVVNFYKLAGKTYETYVYGNEQATMQSVVGETRVCNPETQISTLLEPTVSMIPDNSTLSTL
jgi:hypothetical protein